MYFVWTSIPDSQSLIHSASQEEQINSSKITLKIPKRCSLYPRADHFQGYRFTLFIQEIPVSLCTPGENLPSQELSFILLQLVSGTAVPCLHTSKVNRSTNDVIDD